jgi:hypothetical protein
MKNTKSSSVNTTQVSKQLNNELVTKKDLFNVIKHGSAWVNDKIKIELENVIEKKPHPFLNTSFRWDSGDDYYFIYSTDCYLFIIDGKIETRCDRENVYSSGKVSTYPINTVEDIELAYTNFASMTMEGEDD